MSKLAARDNALIWHPFTQHLVERDPIGISHAKDAVLYDTHGREIIDLISSWWTITHGHAHPKITEALQSQAEKMSHVMFSGFTHEPAVTLAESLTAKLGGDLSRVFFSDNGSTSVEVALKIAYHYWRNIGEFRRANFIAFEGGYHGDTFGAMSVGRGSGFFSPYEDLMCNVELMPYADLSDDSEQAALQSFEKFVESNGETVAAVIMEPLIQGAGGMRMCRPSFVRGITEIARSHGILVIFDEVMVGFGRTGSLFAHQQCGVAPDLICLSKGLTAGTLPLSLTIATSKLYDAFLGEDFSKALAHGHSFTGNPLACAVANCSLQLFEEEATLERIGEINRSHHNFLTELQTHKMVSAPRICGSIVAFELAGEGDGYKSELSLKLRDYYIEHGLNIRPLGSTVYLMPPYCTTSDQLSLSYDGLLEGLDKLGA